MIRHPLARAAGLLVLLAWAPLPFGSVRPAAATAIVVAALLLAAFALGMSRDEPIPSRAAVVATALVAIGALGALQSLPWPTAVASWWSPTHVRLAIENATLLGRPEPGAVVLSLAPGASRRVALLWLAAAAILVAAVLAGRSRRARRGLLAVLAGGALFQILYGVPRWLARATTIWGVEVPNQPTRLRGTFVNPNHLATFLLIATPAVFALLWWLLRRSRAGAPTERWLLRLAPAAALWLVLFTGLALTRSRAGLVAAVGGLLVQVGLVARARGSRRALWGVTAALVAALAFVAVTGFETGFGRFLRLSAERDFRFAAMADAAHLVPRFPVTGVGLGAFRAAFPLVHPVEPGTVWWHAHNDWLELVVTTGLVGGALAAIGLAALLRGLVETWRRGAASEDRGAALAAIGAVVAVGLQELLDFGLTLPANAIALSALCGAALAAPRAARHSNVSGEDDGDRSTRVRG